MKRSNTLVLAAAAVTLSLGGLAFAQPHGLTAFIADFDTNKDDIVTHAEYRTIRDARFVPADRDRSGGLNEAEYVGEYAARLEAGLAASVLPADQKAEERDRQMKQAHVRFGVLDKNKDGAISLEEYLETGERSYASQDTDKDGKITINEPPKTETN